MTTSTRYQVGTRAHKRIAQRAKRLAKRYQAAAPKPELMWLSVKDAAATIGWSVSTMRTRANSGEFPTRKDGRRIMVGLDRSVWS